MISSNKLVSLIGSQQNIQPLDAINTNVTLAGHFGKEDLKSGNEVTPGHVSSFGVPKILQKKKHVMILDHPKKNTQVLGGKFAPIFSYNIYLEDNSFIFNDLKLKVLHFL